MSRIIDQLPDKSSLLLMYLAGEVPAEDRAAVERSLGSDEALRAELEQLRAAQAAFEAGLARLDATTPLPVDEAAAVRNVGRAIRRWQARPLPAAGPAGRRGLRLGGLMVSWRVAGAVAAAAVVLVAALLVPRGGTSPRHSPRDPIVRGSDPAEDAVASLQSLQWDAANSLRGGIGGPVDGVAEPGQVAILDPGQPNPLAATDGPIFDIPLDPPGEQAP